MLANADNSQIASAPSIRAMYAAITLSNYLASGVFLQLHTSLIKFIDGGRRLMSVLSGLRFRLYYIAIDIKIFR